MSCRPRTTACRYYMVPPSTSTGSWCLYRSDHFGPLEGESNVKRQPCYPSPSRKVTNGRANSVSLHPRLIPLLQGTNKAAHAPFAARREVKEDPNGRLRSTFAVQDHRGLLLHSPLPGCYSPFSSTQPTATYYWRDWRMQALLRRWEVEPLPHMK